MTIPILSAIMTTGTFIIYLLLMGMALAIMVRRLILYRRAKQNVPILLKRSLVLFISLAIVIGEVLALRIIGYRLSFDGLDRLIFQSQQSVIIISALAYWVKVELLDIDNPKVT